MTVAWFDLGQRLRAADSGQPVARLVGAPVAPGPEVVAVRARITGRGVTGTVTSPTTGPVTAHGLELLDALHGVGVSMSAAHPVTLVTDTADTLPALVAACRPRDLPGHRESVAAHIGWWADRADYPGGRAVLDLIEACRARWTLGVDPRDDHTVSTWAPAFGLDAEDPRCLLDLLARVREGAPLTYLDVLAEDDVFAWGVAQSAHSDGRDWRRPDSVARAALGLRTRCDAADLYAAALLSDPAYRRRAVHTGHVVVGRAEELSGRRVRVTCDRLDARLRPGATITGFVGVPTDRPPTFDGEVVSATVHDGHLSLTLSGVSVVTGPATGETVTLYDAPPSLRVQRHGRGLYRGHYADRRSWLTTGRAPVPARREVPLSVLVAGAADE